MSEERELGMKQTALLVPGKVAKMGTAIVTSERLVFFDSKFMSGIAGGLIGAVLADSLQKRHESGGPLLEVPIAAITAGRRQKKLLNKDRLELETQGGPHLFNDGWKDIAPLLRTALADLGLRVIEDGPDSWRVEPG